MHLPDALDRVARSGRPDPDQPPAVTGSAIASLLPSVPAWELAIRAVLIYAGLLIALRLFGKREVGQFTLYDLVFILLVANALQPAITGPDTSLGGGFLLIVVLVGTNYLVGRLDSLPRLHHLFTADPAVIVKDGKYLASVMKREGVEQDEVEMAMREHGVDKIKEVELAVLEPDGTISIVPTGTKMHRTRHKVRFMRRG